MKTLLLFSFFLISMIFSAQNKSDTIYGRPKYVKEYVEFLNDSGPFTFMKGDSEYGHAIIMMPKNLRASMLGTWFETNFCRYTNNETWYDPARQITKEIWYERSGGILDTYNYK